MFKNQKIVPTNKQVKIILKTLLIGLIILSSSGICLASQSKDELANPLGVDNIPDLIGKIIRNILGIVGSLALLMFIYGGLMWMTSGGNEEKVKKAKQIIVSAVFGIVVIFTSYSLLNLVFELLG